MRTFGLTAVALCLAIYGRPVLAEVNALRELFEVLRENGTISESQYRRLVQALDEDPETTERIPKGIAAGVEPVAGNAKGETTKPESSATPQETTAEVERPLESPEGRSALDVGGVVMIDAAAYDEDKNPLGNGTRLRRARIKLEGEIYSDWDYKLSVDFADADADIKSAYVAYSGFDVGRLTLGQFKQPFSLEEATSSRNITFMERALPNVLVPDRAIGLGLQTDGRKWAAAVGVFGESFDEDPADEGDEGWGLAGRFTYAPLASDTRVVHLGGSASFRDPRRTPVRFRIRPESSVTDVRYVNTGSIDDISHLTGFGLEAAAVTGPFSLQGEYVRRDVERGRASPDLDFDGWYAYASWFLTGESRTYNPKRGVFGRVVPRRKRGALELAARYSSVDLTDGPVTGGREDIFAFGVNWYANPRVRFMANYLMIDNDEDADDAGEVAGGDQPKAFQMRVQAQFP